MRTPLCERLGIEHPIVSAPMGPDLSGPDLVAAVSEAGGLGILQAQLHPPELLRAEIRAIREKTGKPFGVNFLLYFPSEPGLEVCLQEKVPLVSFFWGDPAPYVQRVHEAGALVFHQVGSVQDARAAAEAGVDVVIAQGREAGGHVAGRTSTFCLVPAVADAVSPAPVAAAGGIADGRGVAAVLALGAQAAVLGTRFLATPEANAHPHYKQRLLEASGSDTVLTTLFGHGWPDAPHRTLRTDFVRQWEGREEVGNQQNPDEPVIGKTTVAGMEIPLVRFFGLPPNPSAEGDLDSMNLLAGQGVGLVREQKPAGEIVRELAEEADRILGGNLKSEI